MAKTKLPQVSLKSGRDYSVRRRHPWIFSGAVKQVRGDLSDGALVEVYTESGEFLATGHYYESSIAVKILAFEPIPDFSKFIEHAVRSAYETRRALGLTQNSETNAFRLVNGEGDGLPGLIVDIYSRTAVMQLQTTGMLRSAEIIAAGIRTALGDKIETVHNKSGEHVDTENTGENGREDARRVEIKENGYRFWVDYASGQKTGFYLDQRENRKLVESFSGGKEVLNAFSYTGGFSTYALGGGAKSVQSVDSSRPALALLEENIRLNFKEPAHQTIVSDCFDFLSTDGGSNYDLMVVDPPAFAKHRKAIEGALKGYKNINHLALKRLNPGGFLFTFSCSQLITRDMFRDVVTQAAADAGRSAKILYELHQAPCHPVNLAHPEGTYLKGFVIGV